MGLGLQGYGCHETEELMRQVGLGFRGNTGEGHMPHHGRWSAKLKNVCAPKLNANLANDGTSNISGMGSEGLRKLPDQPRTCLAKVFNTYIVIHRSTQMHLSHQIRLEPMQNPSYPSCQNPQKPAPRHASQDTIGR